jgi:hypothetical protein|tara:strand:+ start:476 stop:694 length:219 start_codon:yes stop_codon:yes gene_type:complete
MLIGSAHFDALRWRSNDPYRLEIAIAAVTSLTNVLAVLSALTKKGLTSSIRRPCSLVLQPVFSLAPLFQPWL